MTGSLVELPARVLVCGSRDEHPRLGFPPGFCVRVDRSGTQETEGRCSRMKNPCKTRVERTGIEPVTSGLQNRIDALHIHTHACRTSTLSRRNTASPGPDRRPRRGPTRARTWTTAGHETPA